MGVVPDPVTHARTEPTALPFRILSCQRDHSLGNGVEIKAVVEMRHELGRAD